MVAISDLMAAANCSGEPPATSIPAASNFSLTSGLASTCRVSRFSRFTIAAGVFAGASMPKHGCCFVSGQACFRHRG